MLPVKPRHVPWLLLMLTAAEASTPSPEQQTLELARKLKPMSDARWSEILSQTAKDELKLEYVIAAGDTLWGISQRLFGDPFYWPKIWAINGMSIPNPHWIKPGAKLFFTPGTATSLPALAMGDYDRTSDRATDADSGIIRTQPRSREWMQLPDQSWEQVRLTLPPEVDTQGIDTRSRYQIPRATGFDIKQFASSEELPVLGKIQGAAIESNFFTVGNTVILGIDAATAIQPGQVFALVRKPTVLKTSFFGRKGYSYWIDGQLKVLGQKNGSWMGQIVSATGPIEREESLMVQIPVHFEHPVPVAAPQALEATLLLDRDRQTASVAQHHFAYIDRGTSDGVGPGMVFRSFQYEDLQNSETLTAEDILFNGDVIVIHSSQEFSTVMVINSQILLSDGSKLKALTELTGARTPFVTPKTPAANELDGLEGNSNLSEEEKKNLQQLEKKKEEESFAPEAQPIPEETAPLPETPPSTDANAGADEVPPAELPPQETAPEQPSSEEPPTEEAPPF